MVGYYYPERQRARGKIDGETWRERGGGGGSERKPVGGMFGAVYLNSGAVSSTRFEQMSKNAILTYNHLTETA